MEPTWMERQSNPGCLPLQLLSSESSTSEFLRGVGQKSSEVPPPTSPPPSSSDVLAPRGGEAGGVEQSCEATSRIRTRYLNPGAAEPRASKRGSGIKIGCWPVMKAGSQHQAVTKNSRSSSTGVSRKSETAMSEQHIPRTTCTVATLRACSGTLPRATRTRHRKAAALAIEVLRHGLQTRGSRAPDGLAASTLSRSSLYRKRVTKSSGWCRRTSTSSLEMSKVVWR